MDSNEKNTVDTTDKSQTVDQTNVDNEKDAKAIKIMRIAIAALLVLATLMALLVFIPVKGELTNSLTSSDLNGDGTAIRVIGEVRNETNKIAYNVTYKIDVYDADGELIKTYTKDISMLFPKTGTRYAAYLYFDEAIETTCDVEVTVDGYIVGG